MQNAEHANLIRTISEATGLSKVLAGLLVERGCTSVQSATEFLNPSLEKLSAPSVLRGIKEGAELVKKHLKKGKILIFGDYDCDGIGASALLYLALREHGGNAEVFIPTRIEDGYGLSLTSLQRAVEKSNPTLLITVDCGIGSVEEVAYANAQGIDVLITDHHEPSEILPSCIVIDPKTQDDAPALCGAGVAFFLVSELFGKEYALKFIDICAVSTIADLVPLTGDNRIIAAEGLKQLSGRAVREGFRELFKVSGHKHGEPVTAGDIAYKIAPRLNASGRLSDAEKSFKLLTSTDAHLLHILAEELEQENRTRQELCTTTIEQARKMLLDYDLTNLRIIVLCNDEWEGGVIGIAAAKLAEEFKRPTVLFVPKNGALKGSCRSIPGINIHEVLSAASETVIQFGGHSMAAGLSIETEMLPKFIAATDAYIKKTASAEVFSRTVRCDASVELAEINMDFAEQLRHFEPFGMDNPRPVFGSVCGALDFERIKQLNHIKCHLRGRVDIVAFNALDSLSALRSPAKKTLYYTVDKDIFRGEVSVKCGYRGMELKEIAPGPVELITSLARKYVPRNPRKKEVGSPFGYDAYFGRLLLTSSRVTYDRLISEYPDYVRAFGVLSGVNPHNTVLLAPAFSADLTYYSVIEVYDTPPAAYVDYLKASYRAEVIVHNNAAELPDCPIKPDRAQLTDAFSYIRAYLAGKRAMSAADAYLLLHSKGYSGEGAVFELAYLIFAELGVIFVATDGLLAVSKEKKSLEDSRILKLTGGKC